MDTLLAAPSTSTSTASPIRYERRPDEYNLRGSTQPNNNVSFPILSASSSSLSGGSNVWPSFRGNSWNGGSSSVVGSTTAAIGWTFCTGGEVYATPVVDNLSNVYFSSYDNTLYAFTATGGKRWAYTLSSKSSASPALSADGSAVYAAVEDGTVNSVRTNIGTALWTYKACGKIYSGATVGADGTVYITTFYGGGSRQCGTAYLYALRPADGTVKVTNFLRLRAPYLTASHAHTHA